jgi:hypothetical protein
VVDTIVENPAALGVTLYILVSEYDLDTEDVTGYPTYDELVAVEFPKMAEALEYVLTGDARNDWQGMLDLMVESKWKYDIAFIKVGKDTAFWVV